MTELADRVAKNAVFIYPTETIYGIGGRGDTESVEKRIRSIKERKKHAPLILIADDSKRFKTFKLNFPSNAKLLAKRFWPGNLTLVLPSDKSNDGIAVRVSNHPFFIALYERLDVPIFSTSANLSDQPYVNDPEAIYMIFEGKVDFMVDAGKLPESKPSTVVKVNQDDSIEILREGVIVKEEIDKIINSR
jgi:L-threonylcarbamoyladenylate synthase